MNQRNLRKLRKAINATPDANFNYRDPGIGSGCGCVIPVVERLTQGKSHTSQFLGVSDEEARYVLGWDASFDPQARYFGDMTPAQARGANGKREALRRLSVLARRYSVWNKSALRAVGV